MKVDYKKVEIAMARSDKSLNDLKKVFSPGTLCNFRHGRKVLPKTVGKLARLLETDPAELVE